MAEIEYSVGLAYRRLAALPLPARRRAVMALLGGQHRVNRLLRGRPPGGGHAEIFQKVLRLSRREALRLERDAQIHDVAAEVEWLSILARNTRGIRADADRTRVDGAAVMERVAGTGRPVIFAPMHMGAYVLGNCHLMLTYFPDRPMLILRQRDDQVMETKVLERIRDFGVDMRFLQVAQRADFLKAVRFGQQGAVIVVFCDLPPSYGSPAPMPMFGLETSFAFGIESLAKLTSATVVPWCSTMGPDGDVIRISRPSRSRAPAATSAPMRPA